MPTTVGILTFISMINTSSERLQARNFFICGYFSFYEQLVEILCSVELSMNKFYKLPLGQAGKMHRLIQVFARCTYQVVPFALSQGIIILFLNQNIYMLCVLKINVSYKHARHMGLVARKPVFGVSNKVRFKPACSATETS